MGVYFAINLAIQPKQNQSKIRFVIQLLVDASQIYFMFTNCKGTSKSVLLTNEITACKSSIFFH